jgi:hypothetical protein
MKFILNQRLAMYFGQRGVYPTVDEMGKVLDHDAS